MAGQSAYLTADCLVVRWAQLLVALSADQLAAGKAVQMARKLADWLAGPRVSLTAAW